MRHRALVLVGLLGLAGCAPAVSLDSNDRVPPQRERPGKLELFGDATRLPTRAGERARRELALAGELAAAVTELGVRVRHVDVRIAEGGVEDKSAVVILASVPERPDPTVPEMIRELATAMVPALDHGDVHVVVRTEAAPARAEPPKRRAPVWALVFAALGLGLSLGVTFERARGERR